MHWWGAPALDFRFPCSASCSTPARTEFGKGTGNVAKLADIGVVGLAVMGANLARNAAHKGFGVAVYNRNGARTDELMKEHGQEGAFHPS